MWRSECVWVSKWAGGAHATAAVLHIPHCSMLSSSIQHGLFFKLWISKDPQLCSSKQIRKDIKEIRHGKEGPGNRKPNAELFPAGITAIWKKLPRWWILPSICSRTKLYQTHSGGGQILREGGEKKKLPPQLELEHLVFHLHLGMRQLLSFKLCILLLDFCLPRSHLWLSHNQESPSYNMLLLAQSWNQIPEQLTRKFTTKQLLKFYFRL